MNGLKFVRVRCNISLSELADALGVSRQQVSAWENGSKPISNRRLEQLEKYFGLDRKYFLEISKEDKDSIISKALYRRLDSKKEIYCFIKQGDWKEDFCYAPHYYPDCKESLNEQMVQVSKQKQETFEEIESVMRYFEIPDGIMDKILAVRRGCKVYDALTRYLRQMPYEAPTMRAIYYDMARNVLFSLLLANGLLSKEEIGKEFYEEVIGDDIYDDRDWIYEQAEIFKEKYEEKKQLMQKRISEIR